MVQDQLPYLHRLAFTMVAIVLWFFERDIRITTVVALLSEEINTVAKTEEDFDNFLDTISLFLKTDRHFSDQSME